MPRRPKPAARPALVLNPRGTIFTINEGARQHLVPFVLAAGGTQSRDRIEASYHQACIGELEPDQLWERVGLGPEIEDDYLATIPLHEGIHDFLERAASRFVAVACVGKEIGRWSRKLRALHGLDHLIGTWLVSGEGAGDDVDRLFGLEQRLRMRRYDMIFVDSVWRFLMLAQASSAAIRLIDPPLPFNPEQPDPSVGYPRLNRLEDLLMGEWVARPEEIQFGDARPRWSQVLD